MNENIINIINQNIDEDIIYEDMDEFDEITDKFDEITDKFDEMTDDDLSNLIESFYEMKKLEMIEKIHEYNAREIYIGLFKDYCIENELEDWIDLDHYDFIKFVIEIVEEVLVPRSVNDIECYTKNNTERYIQNIEGRILELNKVNENLPEQRTDEWYNMRYNMLSASNLWKILHTTSTYNQLVKEKTESLEVSKINKLKGGFNSSLVWGQRYEDVAQQIFEDMYNTEISSYGCIPHFECNYIGASPDGINTKKESGLYGHMLEIKCIVNRELTGIPKKEYWIQMQMQMECCNLDYCDFFECRFKEYENEIMYMEDGEMIHKTNDGRYKGMMITYMDETQNYKYLYMPLNIENKEEYNKWYNNKIEWIDSDSRYNWIKNIYWYLDEYSSVMVPRNRDWYIFYKDKIRDTWRDIENKRLNIFSKSKKIDNTKIKCNINKKEGVKNIYIDI